MLNSELMLRPDLFIYWFGSSDYILNVVCILLLYERFTQSNNNDITHKTVFTEASMKVMCMGLMLKNNGGTSGGHIGISLESFFERRLI